MSSDSFGRFDVVEKPSESAKDPRLSVYANGEGYLNSAAVRALEGPSAVRYLLSESTGELAIEPTDADDRNAYALVRADDHAGADVSIKTALAGLDVDIDAMDESHFVALEQEGEFLVGDLSGLPGVSVADDRDEGRSDGDDVSEETGTDGDDTDPSDSKD